MGQTGNLDLWNPLLVQHVGVGLELVTVENRDDLPYIPLDHSDSVAMWRRDGVRQAQDSFKLRMPNVTHAAISDPT